jgi:Spinocerebellar ataxia type 10 protein domain
MLLTTYLQLSTYAQRAINQALHPPTKPISITNSTSRSRQRPCSEMSSSTWFEESPNVSDVEDAEDEPSPSPSKKNGSSSKPKAPSRPLPLPPPAELDLLLPKVCEGLVLIAQCVSTIVLEEEEVQESGNGKLKTAFNQALSEDGKGLIENLVGTWCALESSFFYNSSRDATELLRLLDQFLPRINFGKPVGVPIAKTEQEIPVQENGFFYLKRDLVRLLGLLCNRVPAVQDRVRECGGIPIVMNLCVVDERNPCAYSYFLALKLIVGRRPVRIIYGILFLRFARTCYFHVAYST